ncbi:MAG: CofH family radical SAM protein [Planctomycetes bacterium]|nr:CofH family radical SAM protein [Planctomycetota bacterium]
MALTLLPFNNLGATPTADVAAVVEKALSGRRLSYDEGAFLYEHGDLTTLGFVAHELRLSRADPGRVTYLVDRNVNYTNVCVTLCGFCAFYRPPGHPEGYVNSREVLGAKLAELRDLNGTRVLLQGGHNPDLRLPYYEDLVAWMHATFPTIEIDAFSPSEIDHLARLEGMSMEDVLRRLQNKGMAGLPGGGAEILDDEVRAAVSPKKQNTAGWLQAMRVAQRLGMNTSATMVIGFGENFRHRMNHLDRVRRLQDESLRAHGNGFTSFIPWTLQLGGGTPLHKATHRGALGARAREYLRHVALCRIYLDNFAHVAASWPTMGERVASLALHFGADDFGSTMLEENVVSAAGTKRRRMGVPEIAWWIRRAGFEPAQRDTAYRILEPIPC